MINRVLKSGITKMSQDANELSEIKCVIRGLLISSTRETTIYQLQRDYFREEGGPIPFMNFGYPSVELFLRSMSDTVILIEPEVACHPSLIIVEPVQSKKSEHVRKMIMKQKKPMYLESKKRGTALAEAETKKWPRNHSKFRGMNERFIPITLRTALYRVCRRCAPGGLPLNSLGKELSRDFSMVGWPEEGCYGWVKMCGFSNIEEMIDDLKCVGLIKITTRNGQEWIHFNFNCERKSPQILKEMERRGNKLKPKTRHGEVVKAMAHCPSSDECSDEEAQDLMDCRMKKNFVEIMTKHPNGLWCSNLPHEYKVHTGEELNLRKIGYNAVIQMAFKLRDIFICSRPGKNSDWLLFGCQSNALGSASHSRIEGLRLQLPSYYKNNIEWLLMDYPVGIKMANFLKAYKHKYGEDFPWPDFGFKNPKHLLRHLAKTKVVHFKYKGNVPVVYRKDWLSQDLTYANEDSSRHMQLSAKFGESLVIKDEKNDSSGLGPLQHPSDHSVCSVENRGRAWKNQMPQESFEGSSSLPIQSPRSFFDLIRSQLAK